MTRQEIIDLMSSSQTESEWNDNCDKVKDAHDGLYPPYWYEEIVAGGLVDEVRARWGDIGPLIKVVTF